MGLWKQQETYSLFWSSMTCMYYNIKVDLKGKKYIKIELDWDYKNGKVHLFMKPYLAKAL